MKIKAVLKYGLLLIGFLSFAQEKDQPQDVKYIYNGNQKLQDNNFVDAEAEYRNAISENPVNPVSKFNLGNAYFKNKKTDEALARYQQAQKVAETKGEKHKAFHNMGNSYMQQKKYDEAIEAYKNALRNNPTDEETRYNLAYAKEKKKEQDEKDDQNKDKKQDKQDNKDKKDKKDDKNKNDQDSDNKDDEGKKDDNKDSDKQDDKEKDKKQDDNGKEDDKKDKQDDKKQEDSDQKKKEQPKPQPGQLSPQQVQSLLDAMNNQEKKLQEKMNAKKAKGVPVKNEKDW
jgi:tetratricopeptide (TPR) repeat protein